MNFQESGTCAALMRAYAGECQSHVRYLLAAKEATARKKTKAQDKKKPGLE